MGVSVVPNLNLLIAINAGTLITIIVIGYKVITFLNNIKFKTDLMWEDYKVAHELAHVHSRVDDK